MITQYLEHHFLDQNLSHYVAPKKNYKYQFNAKQKQVFADVIQKNLSELDKLISNIEPDGKKIPVLIKKYLKQNAAVLGINVDPSFNNAIDVLMYIDIAKLDGDKYDR